MADWWDTTEGLEQLRTGDPEARRRLAVALWPDAKAYAHHLLGGDQDVDDVLQETFLGVFKGLERFNGNSRLKTWVFSILHNKVSDLFSRRTKSRRREESLEGPRRDDAGSGADPAGMHEDETVPSPEALTHGREIRQTLENALPSLPLQQREVFLLRDVRGFSSEEVCNILQIKPTHQRVLLHRARVALRDALAEGGHRK